MSFIDPNETPAQGRQRRRKAIDNAFAAQAAQTTPTLPVAPPAPEQQATTPALGAPAVPAAPSQPIFGGATPAYRQSPYIPMPSLMGKAHEGGILGAGGFVDNNRGLLGGAAMGGVLGGPIGALAGAALGAGVQAFTRKPQASAGAQAAMGAGWDGVSTMSPGQSAAVTAQPAAQPQNAMGRLGGLFEDKGSNLKAGDYGQSPNNVGYNGGASANLAGMNGSQADPWAGMRSVGSKLPGTEPQFASLFQRIFG